MELKRDYFVQAEELSDAQLLLLGLIAYVGRCPSESQYKRVLSYAGLKEVNHNSIVNELKEKNLVRDDSSYSFYYSLKVDPFLFFPIVFHIIYFHPVFANLYKKTVPSNSDRDYDNVRIWGLVNAIKEDDDRAIKELCGYYFLRSDNQVKMCLAMMFEPAFRSIVYSLGTEAFRNLIAERLRIAMALDAPMNFDDDAYDLITDYIVFGCGSSWANYDTIFDMVTAYKFFYDAEAPEWKHNNPTEWSYAVEAICQLYKGNYAKANALFASSHKLRNKESREKNMYHDTVLAYYWMLSCAFTSVEGRHSAEAYLAKNYVQTHRSAFPSEAVARYLVLNRKSDNCDVLVNEYVHASDLSRLSFAFAGIIGHALEYSALDVNIDAQFYPYFSKWALLRYEASAFAKIDDRESLSSLLDGTPVIGRVRRKPQWEQAIEDLSLMVTDNPKKAVSSMDAAESKRIVYELSMLDYVTIREQTMTKKGIWSKGTNLNNNLYQFSRRPSMDEHDKAVAAFIRKKEDRYIPRASEILPLLVGCDRVFALVGDRLQNVEVVAEKLFIELEETPDGIVASGNLDHSMIVPGQVVRKDSDVHYSVFDIGKEEAAVAERLLSVKEFPLQAVPMIKPLVEQISKKVEIHSSMLSEGSTLDKRNGDARVVIQLSPDRDMFQLNIGVRPLEKGSLFLKAGKGAPTIYDSAEGQRFQIGRDISAEQQNSDNLMDFCQRELSSLEMFDEQRGVLDMQDCLALMEYISENPESCTMEWPKGESLRLKAKLASSSISAGIRTGESWFEVEGNVQMDEKTVIALRDLMTLFAGNGNRRFIRLADGDFVVLTHELRRKLLNLQDVQSSAGKVPVFQVGMLASMIRGKDAFLSADKDFESVMRKVKKAQKMEVEVPKSLFAQLRDYQLQGFEWMMRLFEWGAGACLADDMGLGKTVQAIAAILSRKGPALVVAPASVILNWVNEIGRFAPSLNCTILNESTDRAALVKSAGDGDVILCSYAILTRENEILAEKQWGLVCLDEAHTIKNKETKMSDAAMSLKADARLALTGTPLQNNLAELWNLFQFINPGLLGTYQNFSQKYITSDMASDNVKRLKNVIGPFVLRRRKVDVVDELPAKTDIRHDVQLNYLETAAYEAIRLEAKAQIDAAEAVDVTSLAYITRLRQAACSLELVQKSWDGGSSKVEEACQLIRQVVESGDRILVFSQFTSFLKLVCQTLDMHDGVLYLDGTTPIRRREAMVKEFQAGKAQVFFISLKAGGLGLNLTAANYVLHLDPWWNPAIEQQATDRAHRIGQNRAVTVYHLISANTIEEKILRLHKVKRDMADALLSGTDVARSLTLEQLRDLVSDSLD